MKPAFLSPLRTRRRVSLILILLCTGWGLNAAAPRTNAMPVVAPTFSCGDVSQIPATECNALVTLFNATSSNSWTNKSGWLATTTPCTWYGVTCSGGQVTQLRLQSNGLTGTLPVDLQDLTMLNWLELQYNSLSGPIPAELGLLSELTELALYSNAFSGTIPETLSHLFKLNALRLGYNNLSGTIPPELSYLPALTILGIDSNKLTGSLPPELGNMTGLTLLNANDNQLSGPIPATFGDFPVMWRLWLENNQLSGQLPSQLGNLTALRNFSVRNNALKDEIPTTFTNLTALTKLDLGYNGLKASGTTLKNFLNNKDPDWAETQTILPLGLTAGALSANSIKLSWTPIVYVGDGGYYEIRSATTPGGPYTVQGVTTNKSSSDYTVNNLSPNTTYYFVLRTYTPAHASQQNALWSGFSGEVSATTQNATTQTAPTITSAPVTTALRGQAYAYSVAASGSAPLLFSLLQQLAGMTINPNTGFISWTPAEVGAFAVTVKVSNSVGPQEQSFTITVNETPKISSAPPTNANVNQPYAYDVDAGGTPAPTFSLLAPPAGMTIDGGSGLINWTPTATGLYSVTVTANNSVGSNSQFFTIIVNATTTEEAPQISSTPLTSANVNQLYTYDVDASGRPNPQFTLTAAPVGMAINGTTGAISWTPTTSGNVNVTVRAANNAGNDSQSFTIVVSAAPTGDSYEDDDSCARATTIPTSGAEQLHNFHDLNDPDWVKFTAQAGRTYIIDVESTGARADAVIELYELCEVAPAATGDNAFGNSVRLEWDATRNSVYLLKLQQLDPSIAGAETDYVVAVMEDDVPPSTPKSPRCSALSDTALAIQWKQNPERDVRGYRIAYTGNVAGNEDVDGNKTTYYELKELALNQTTRFRLRAVDFSGNESAPSGEVECVAEQRPENTKPAMTLSQPAGGTTYTTTAAALTFTGVAQDPGGNLSRVKVRNNTTGTEAQDFGLSGASAPFRVEDVTLAVGNNNVRVTAYDDAGNTTDRDLVVQRLGESPGAVLIVAGRNETSSLQTNIYNSTNRAYRIFKSAGYSDDDIYYLAAVEQKPDGDVNRVDAPTTPANLENAITEWARGRVGFGQPFTIYLMDHGFADRYCVDGCAAGGHVTPTQVNQWLETLETATGVNQVNIIIDACQSGSFLDRFNGEVEDIQNSLSRQNRVVITSTGRQNNAYASAQGAYFSDAFFSCLADSGDLKSCFEQGKSAVTVTGVDQTPWLDDNGDGLYNSADGTIAQARFVTRFFSSVRPTINTAKIERSGTNGTITADVLAGAEEVEIVWAAIYPPNFVEPDDVTLNLQVPTVRLEPDSSAPNRYSFTYVNGFTEAGDYRVVFYAQDRLGIHAQPRLPGGAPVPTAIKVFLPLVAR